MAEETKVLLINDNDATRHDLETVLSFVGEQVVSASSANWHSTITEAVSKPQQVCLALINDCQQLDTLQLLKDLHAWEPGLGSCASASALRRLVCKHIVWPMAKEG